MASTVPGPTRVQPAAVAKPPASPGLPPEDLTDEDEPARAPLWVPLLAVPVAFLAFVLPSVVVDPPPGEQWFNRFDSFVEFWTANGWADLLFVVATLVAAFVGWMVALRPAQNIWRSALASFAAALPLHWLAWTLYFGFSGAGAEPTHEFWSWDPRATLGVEEPRSVFLLALAWPGGSILAASALMPALAGWVHGRHRPSPPIPVRAPHPALVPALLVAAVLVSTGLGLLTPALAGLGADVYGDVWSADLAGNVVFTVGTMAAAAAAWTLMSALAMRGTWRAGAIAVAVGLLMHWAVYIAAWGFSSWDDGFLNATWHWEMEIAPGDSGPHAAAMTLTYGWTGLVAMALSVPVTALYVAHRQHVQATRAERTAQPAR